jgi:predicted aspartyl protease
MRKSERPPPRQELILKGEVEDKIVEDMLLDTGCSQMLVRQELVPEDKLTNRQVSIRCAHGDILEYPVADVQIRMCDKEFTVKAGVSDRLPRSVLLGTDVPAWRDLLNGAIADDGVSPHALVVTRSQRTAIEKAEAERVEKEFSIWCKA